MHPNSLSEIFQGKFEHVLDEKGRIAIPSLFRKKLETEGQDEAKVIVTLSDQCLAAYPEKIWQEKLSLLAKFNQFTPEVMQFKRIFVGCAQECVLDKSGRILLPTDLRDQVKISKDCIIIGQIEKFEIWSLEHWKTTFYTLSDQVSQVYAKIGALGLTI